MKMLNILEIIMIIMLINICMEIIIIYIYMGILVFILKKLLNIFFEQAYADIKQVKYKKEQKENKISYELYFYKKIGGSIKEIPSRLESDGTKRILEQFDTLMGALVGETVIIDEIDNGVHDLLIKNIIVSMKDEITGQLIITTHNTLLFFLLCLLQIYSK